MTAHEASLDCAVAKYGHNEGRDNIDNGKHAYGFTNGWALHSTFIS
jgi:hypothetical protein